MGNVMIALDDEHEALLRRLAQEHGAKKGSLSLVVRNALDLFATKNKRQTVKERLKKTFSTGLDFQYRMYQKRSEIYD